MPGDPVDPPMVPAPDWEDIYRQARPEQLPWFSPHIDPDFDEALTLMRVRPQDGPILDLGTGPGTAAIELAKRGYDVTALDVSPSAIRMAQKRAGPLAERIRWVAQDLFAAQWKEPFNLIHDRGLYHSLEKHDRMRYPEFVAGWLRPQGFLMLKTFSPLEPGTWGPHRIPKYELETNVGGMLDILRIDDSSFPGTVGHAPKAWFGVFRAPARKRRR